MSDDLPPVIDLASFRAGRASAKARPGQTLRVSIEDGQLCFRLSTGATFGMPAETVAWLKQWIFKFEAAERAATAGPDRHRCHTCRLVKWIECRGHRPWGETRTHYAVEVIEWRTTTHTFVQGDDGGFRAVPEEKRRPYKARTSCKRISRDTAMDWAKVDCANCLRRKPKAVP